MENHCEVERRCMVSAHAVEHTDWLLSDSQLSTQLLETLRGRCEEQGRWQGLFDFGLSLSLLLSRAPPLLFFHALRFCSQFNLNKNILLLQRENIQQTSHLLNEPS